MNTIAATATTPNNSARRAILLGGLCAGFADFLYATIGALQRGTSPLGPWKGVAGGLLGKSAREGGVATALLGVALHFFIALSGAALLYFIVRNVKFVPRQWLVLGVLYGLAFLAVMNYVILPLSAIGHSIYGLDTMHITAFWHIVLVGLPTAWFISRSLPA